MDICKVAEAKWTAGDRSWTECTEENLEYFRDVLPPIYVPGAFGCSEPWKHIGSEGVYLFFRRIAGHCEARYATLREMDPKAIGYSDIRSREMLKAIATSQK